MIDSCHAQGMASSKEQANNRPPLPKGFTQTALPKNIIIVGDRNIGINIGTAGDITLGNLSSGS
ncbi:peptidase C14 caspase catalytic subunit p20 [Tolypothrix sp. NIES-4075]|uniref:hypothetical protein n=1 Tax=Tolypothrix sp. NIES-4075 TaxID=2005459 RepID=UPI000B5CF043|nr:hypothetical protein [Tolypothrix sp. NIES-4075]GAX40143.1 peptidase C14 caspase catalytic subunit p20 [Tolypothrix sp. NIES-4075]